MRRQKGGFQPERRRFSRDGPEPRRDGAAEFQLGKMHQPPLIRLQPAGRRIRRPQKDRPLPVDLRRIDGIARKIIQVSAGSSGFIFFLSFFFYVLNFVEISIDVGLYFRNKKLDELADSQNA